jgi:hypothetical protein
VDPSAIQGLGIAPTGVAPVHTPSTGANAHQASVYDVSLVLLHPALSLNISNVAIVEAQLSIQGIQALIGRDVLKNCLLVYDGQAGTFTLAF